jgi:hypothetical protein
MPPYLAQRQFRHHEGGARRLRRLLDPEGVDLDRLDPIFFDFADGRAAQKRRFGGEFFPNVVEAGSGLVFAEFFQNERDTGRKGVVVLDIKEVAG